jgi:cell wall-associated NlpC family hydrolase
VRPPDDRSARPPAPAPTPGDSSAGSSASTIPSAPNIDGPAIAAAALAERGRPYRLGGETPAGFDCSGLVQYVFAQQGIALPRQVIDQFTVGQPVPRREIQAGDLLFFATTSDDASHVGIALDRDRFVDAPSAHGHVRIDRLSAPYWSKRFLGAKRIEASAATREAGPPSR